MKSRHLINLFSLSSLVENFPWSGFNYIRQTINPCHLVKFYRNYARVLKDILLNAFRRVQVKNVYNWRFNSY